jgi:hypothetical protein
MQKHLKWNRNVILDIIDKTKLEYLEKNIM